MLIVISPAKSLDFDSEVKTTKHSKPLFIKEASSLVKNPNFPLQNYLL